jgi:hypothetical protein
MQLLLDLLRGNAAIADGSESQWQAVLDLAHAENILPWTAARLRALPAPLPPAIHARLRQIQRDLQLSAFFWTSTLTTILTAFHESRIPVISLKGPWMAERLLGDASLRACTDLDLLVRPADLVRSEEILVQLGFHPRGRRDDHERHWDRGAVSIDLHHDVENPLAFDFNVQGAWERSRLSEFHGVPARLLSPGDELLFLCLHSARHRFERLSHILDLTFALKNLSLPATGRSSPRKNEIDLVAFGSMMAAHLDPRSTLSICAPLAPRDRDRLQQLAGRIWSERLTAPCPFTDWRARHAFYLMMETRPLPRVFRRVRHFRILLTRLIDADFAFAARFHLHHPWQVWLLRPIRLLSHIARAAPSPS